MSGLDESLRRAIHEALLVEHFGDLEPHNAYRDPQSDMGWQARRIAAHVAAVLREQIAAAQAEAWDEGFRTACGDQGIVYDIGLRPLNPYRAAQLAPARVPSEEG